jgi:hypothetical protein
VQKLAELNDDDERFAELIREGFGVDVSGPAPKDQARPGDTQTERPAFVMPDTPAPAAAETSGTQPVFFDFDNAFERADRNPDDFDAFRPPNPAPLGRPQSPLQWFAMVCLVLSVTLLVLVLVGVSMPANVVLADILIIVGSIATIWRTVPKRPAGYEDYDDGIRL